MPLIGACFGSTLNSEVDASLPAVRWHAGDRCLSRMQPDLRNSAAFAGVSGEPGAIYNGVDEAITAFGAGNQGTDRPPLNYQNLQTAR